MHKMVVHCDREERLPNLKILDLRYSKNLMRTPDFEGLPCLERFLLDFCEALEEIHPSIGYHNNLVYVSIICCQKLEMFPPIISMKKLETLLLKYCKKLQKFPDIQTSMDSLLNLDLSCTQIEIIPQSVGRFCTNLVSLRLIECHKLKRIEADFHLLKSLKDLDLTECQLLSQHSTSLDLRLQSFHQESSVSRKLPQFSCFIKKLCLGDCNLGDGDIPSNIHELSNLQVLDLRGNQFSRLPSSLSRIPCLKLLNLSYCSSLVELPDLPSSIAILKADCCYALESVGDLSNYKWLWKVSFRSCNKLSGCGRLPHSMLQVNAVEDRFMSVILPTETPVSNSKWASIIILQLPHNWYSDISGLLFCFDKGLPYLRTIIIKEDVSMDSQLDNYDNDYWEEFEKKFKESFEYSEVGYVPFGSLRHIPWWNSACTKKISFEIHGKRADFKVGLVPRKSKIGDSRETSNATTINSPKF